MGQERGACRGRAFRKSGGCLCGMQWVRLWAEHTVLFHKKRWDGTGMGWGQAWCAIAVLCGEEEFQT